DQGSDPQRGHPLDRHHPRRSVPAAHVECRRRYRPRRARHRPDPLVHRFRHRRGTAAAVERGGRARGHRSAAIPHGLGRAGAHQYQLADAVQSAQRHRGNAGQIRDGRPAHAPGDGMLRLPARRQLFDASSLGRPCRATALRVARLPARGAHGRTPGGYRRGRRCQPRDRHALPRRASERRRFRRAQGPARCRRLIAPLLDTDTLMNARPQPTMLPFIDLAAQRRRLGSAIDTAVSRVLTHCQFIIGPEVRTFESELAAFAGSKHAVSCASGTDALVLGLRALGIGPGDAVICPSFTFCATAEVAVLVGATPVFVDVLPDTFNIDVAGIPGAIEAAKAAGLTPKAIIPVDLFGLPADHNAIAKAAETNGLFVIDDAAQGFGATYHNRRLGTFGQVTCTSFFPAKPLGCYGDGGAVLTDDDGIADTLRSLRVHGQGSDKYDNVRIGLASRLDT